MPWMSTWAVIRKCKAARIWLYWPRGHDSALNSYYPLTSSETAQMDKVNSFMWSTWFEISGIRTGYRLVPWCLNVLIVGSHQWSLSHWALCNDRGHPILKDKSLWRLRSSASENKVCKAFRSEGNIKQPMTRWVRIADKKFCKVVYCCR